MDLLCLFLLGVGNVGLYVSCLNRLVLLLVILAVLLLRACWWCCFTLVVAFAGCCGCCYVWFCVGCRDSVVLLVLVVVFRVLWIIML